MKTPISLLTNTQHIQSSNANGVTSNSCLIELRNLYLVRKQRTFALFLIIRCAFGVSLLPIFVSHMSFVALNEMRSKLLARKDWTWVFHRRKSIYSDTKKKKQIVNKNWLKCKKTDDVDVFQRVVWFLILQFFGDAYAPVTADWSDEKRAKVEVGNATAGHG